MKETDVKIRVAVRKRPINAFEISTNDKDILEKRDKNSLVIMEPKSNSYQIQTKHDQIH